MNFEDAFREDLEIPLHEAASFFIGIKKFAEVGDPPDETGMLEGQFAVPVEEALQIMSELVRNEFETIYAYSAYAQSLRDLSHDSIAEHFQEHGEDELEHAEFLMKRMSVLGGPINLQDIKAPNPSTNPISIIQTLIRMEQEGIAGWKRLLAVVGDNPMRITIEDYMVKEQEHLDDLWQLLPDEYKTGPSPSGPTPEEELPPEEGMGEEVPMEVVASMRLGASLEKKAYYDTYYGGYDPYAAQLVAQNQERALIEELQGDLRLAKTPEQRAAAKKRFENNRVSEGRLGGGIIGGTLGSTTGLALGAAVKSPVVAAGLGLGGAVVGGVVGYRVGGGVGRLQAKRLTRRAYSGMLPVDDEKTAADKASPTDTELKEVGRQRGVAALAAEARREKGRRGERAGQTVGTVGGALGGAALGRKYIGGKSGTIAGLVAGALAGGRAGKEVGTEVDIHKNAAAMRFSLALMKLAEGEMQSQEMAAPTSQEMEPTNYLQAEMVGRQAQEQNESAFYREQLGQAKQQAMTMEQQVQQAQMQLQQVQEQAAQAGAQIQAATQQAVAAQDAATQQSLEAAKARIGAQEMRAKMLELASMDPQMLGEQALAPQPPPGMEGMDPNAMGQPGMGAPPGAGGAPPEAGPPMPPEGPAGAAPTPGAPPGAPPAAEGGMGPAGPTAPVGPPQGAPMDQAAMAGQMKTSSVLSDRLIGAGVGATIGAGSSLYAGHKAPQFAQQAQEMEAKRTGSFLNAVRIAKAKKAAVAAELSQTHPVGSAILGGLGGAAVGAKMGPAIHHQGGRLIENIRDIAGR